MDRKPVKKRKPRVVAKKIVRAKKPKVFNPKFNLKIGLDDDKFFVHPETIPAGVALQWVSIYSESSPNIDQAFRSGWKSVKDCDPVGGLMLVWAPKDLADAQRDANIATAQKQISEIRELFRMDASYIGEGYRFPLVSESFMVSEPYQSVLSFAPPIDVEVTTKFRLSARLQDAAAALNLSPEVYAQRRLALNLRGELGGILIPVDGALELFEGGNFNITSRIN